MALPAAADGPTRQYENKLIRIADPKPLLAEYPDFVAPVKELTRYEAPLLVNDDGADLDVRAWRCSYNARGIIEMPNRLKAAETAVIMVHPGASTAARGGRRPNRPGYVTSAPRPRTPWPAATRGK